MPEGIPCRSCGERIPLTRAGEHEIECQDVEDMHPLERVTQRQVEQAVWPRSRPRFTGQKRASG